MSERTEPRLGDIIVHKRQDGLYNLMPIASGQGEVLLRADVPTLDMAREIARNNLSTGGMLWYTHHEDPDRIEPLR